MSTKRVYEYGALQRAQGLLNVITAEEAAQENNVIEGTFLILSYPARILFDSGASFSFISTVFAHNIGLVSTIPISVDVTLPSGAIMHCSNLFGSVPVQIEGFDFPADLICFPLKDFDVILGMDWLRAFKANLDCEAGKIHLRAPDGTRVSYRRYPSDPTVKLVSACQFYTLLRKGYPLYLCQVQDLSSSSFRLEDIPIVSEFPDVFSDEVTAMPPDREIEFTIDLVPGNTLVSKAPYLMAPVELKELNEQLKDLLEKGYIRPSSSPWGAPVLFVKKKDG